MSIPDTWVPVFPPADVKQPDSEAMTLLHVVLSLTVRRAFSLTNLAVKQLTFTFRILKVTGKLLTQRPPALLDVFRRIPYFLLVNAGVVS